MENKLLAQPVHKNHFHDEVDPPHFTIVVPILEGTAVLKECLDNILSQDYSNFTILVCDNFRNDKIKLLIDSHSDPRIRYIFSGRRLTIAEKWEFAISHVPEGWVTILGDEDGLMPGALSKLASLIRKHKVSAVRSLTCLFERPHLHQSAYGNLSVPLSGFRKIRSCNDQLKLLISGKIGYESLPMPYKGGFLDVALLHLIRDRCGRMFGSENPEIFSAIAVASATPYYLYVGEPLAINGSSSHDACSSPSMREMTTSGNSYHRSNLEDDIPYHSNLSIYGKGPFPRSLHLKTIECILQTSALRDEPIHFDWQDQLRIIMTPPGKNRLELIGWARKFAAANGLNLENAIWDGSHKPLRRALQDAFRWRILPQVVNVVGTPENPLLTVHEAGERASEIYNKHHRWNLLAVFHLAREVRKNSARTLANLQAFKKACGRFARKHWQGVAERFQKPPTDTEINRLHSLMKLVDIDAVVDAGANTGQFGRALREAGYNGLIVSFEPLSAAHSLLEKAAATDPTWLVHPRGALGERSGETTIYVAGNSQSSSVLPMLDLHEQVEPSSAIVGNETAPLMRGEEVFTSYLTDTANPMLKIDTQGYEWEVLKGCGECLSRFRCVVVELSLVPLYEGQRCWTDIVRFLDSQGFKLWNLSPVFADPVDYRLLQVDAVFLKH